MTNFSEEQLKAIDTLEKAFKKVKNAGLTLIGINSSLYISDKYLWLFNQSKQLKDMMDCCMVLKNHETYVNSFQTKIYTQINEDGILETIYSSEPR